MKPRIEDEYVQVDEVEWKPFFAGLCEQGGIRWKLLHVSPEAGVWSVMFDCPAGSYFAPHVHHGPGQYLITKGSFDVRGGKEAGGATPIAPGYGYEATNAVHDRTEFKADTEFFMVLTGPVEWQALDGATVMTGWQEVQAAWNA